MTAACHGPSLLEYYEADLSWHRSLWTTEANCDRVQTNVPHFLHIHLVLFESIPKEGHPSVPHEVLTLALKYIKNGPADQAQAAANTWQLFLIWFVMKAQLDKQGDSLVLFSINAVMEGDDVYFGQWMEIHLGSTITLGKRPVTDLLMGATLAVTPSQVPAQFAVELGKGVAMGLHTLGPFETPFMPRGGVADADSKQGYGEKNIMALMSFSHVKKGEREPTPGHLDVLSVLLWEEHQRLSTATHGLHDPLGARSPHPY